MRLIKQSCEILDQQPGLEGVYKQIERAGRTCYKSEDKITEDSAKEFVDRMIKSGHGAMLEHGTVYLTIPLHSNLEMGVLRKLRNNSHTVVVENTLGIGGFTDENICVTTNLRVILENKLEDALRFMSEPTEYHEKRITVKFVTDQGILREFTRHRVFSFAVESTRYCNYSKDKFDNEITCIEPCWEWYDPTRDGFSAFKTILWEAENYYFYLLEHGWKPQQARNVLPLATKCDMIMTGFVSDWKHFFDLRCPTNAHPQARELANALKTEFANRNYKI